MKKKKKDQPINYKNSVETFYRKSCIKTFLANNVAVN